MSSALDPMDQKQAFHKTAKIEHLHFKAMAPLFCVISKEGPCHCTTPTPHSARHLQPHPMARWTSARLLSARGSNTLFFSTRR